VSANPWRFVLAIPLGIVALAAYGYWQGTPQDIVNAVRRGDLSAVTAALARDPALVHTKVYPQAFERASDRQKFAVTFGGSPWEGRYLIHEASRLAEAVPMLETLTAAGADLSVRLHSRTLLHLAARAGDLEVATWLLERGADGHAVNDCEAGCEQRGQTPLTSATARPQPRAARGRGSVGAMAEARWWVQEGSGDGPFDRRARVRGRSAHGLRADRERQPVVARATPARNAALKRMLPV
jgi:hypothetical protein